MLHTVLVHSLYRSGEHTAVYLQLCTAAVNHPNFNTRYFIQHPNSGTTAPVISQVSLLPVTLECLLYNHVNNSNLLPPYRQSLD
jgi:hypothetical protein